MVDFFRPNNYRDYSIGLFINKYAPKTLDDFKGNIGAVQTLQSYLDANNIPNLIILGPHGCGKSHLVKLLVTEYLGESNLKQGHLEIFGSLSRGKEVVSEQQTSKNRQKNFNCPGITQFLKQTHTLPPDKMKIVTIYEFHQMSPEAQMALRRVMELYSQRVRFIFLTDDHSGIIQALQSRCSIIKLTPIDDSELEQTILNPIIQAENLQVTPTLMKLINLNAEGDIRVAVNLIQILGYANPDDTQAPYDILGIPEIELLNSLITNCRQHQATQAYQKVKTLLLQGFEISDILDLITKVLIKYPEFPEKPQFLRQLCHDTLTIEECYTETQLYNLINHLCFQ